jgi:hypothetical protein
MKARTYAFIICSPHSRTGVTTIARLLGDYYVHTGRSFIGFDTDPHESRFAYQFPECVSIADLATIQGQIGLFDNLLLADRVTRIVDVWSRSWKTFFDIASTTDFFAEAMRRDVTPYVLFVADGSEKSLEAAETMHALWPDLGIAVVGNEGAAPIGPGALDHLARYPATHTFEIPPLDPIVQRVIEEPDFSFSRFLAAPPDQMSIVIRASLRAWLLPIFQQFQSFELRLTLQDSQYFG